MAFTHLHIHDQYSQLDGMGKAEDFCARAVELGMKSIGLTNHGNMDGVIKWQKACKDAGLKPVLGFEAYIVPNMVDKENTNRWHMTILCRNEKGFENCLKMLTYANTQGFYKRPRIDPDLLYEHAEGIAILTGCSFSFLKMEGGVQIYRELRQWGVPIFLEVMPLIFDPQKEMNKLVLQLKRNYGGDLVATNDCHYVKREHSVSQEVLLAIQFKKRWNDTDRFRFDTDELYLRSEEEMKAAFRRQAILSNSEIEEAISNTQKVVDLCNLTVEKRPVLLPKVVVPHYKHLPEDEQIMELALDGLRVKALKHPSIAHNFDTYEERVVEELEHIIPLGFSRYFLIVWELINWCKANDIMCGPGRGSVGGSLVAYCLGITMVDPLKYDLVFSRFISPARIDLPDIDMDFEDRKRHLIREHLEELYGSNNVVGVSTFARMKGKAAIRSVARVFDVPIMDVSRACDCIVTRSGGDIRADFTIEDAFSAFEDGRKFKEKYPQVTKIAMELEGQISNSGQHAAAMCVSAEDLRLGKNANYVQRKGGVLCCNWEKEDAEYMGLMKLDVLGLNALTVLSECLKMIEENHGVDVDLETLPMDDPKVFEQFSQGNNTGVFQFGSESMIKICRDIGIEDFEAVIALNALHRPGCLRSGLVNTYEKRKHGKEPTTYLNDFVKRLTQETYGIILYQEQIMRMLYELGGFPWKVADAVRKVVSKSKGVEKIMEFEQQFVDGCLEKGTLGEADARKLFDDLKYFGNYGFNKAHAAEYAYIAYWQMWLKVHYPAEFIIAQLSVGVDSKSAQYLEEARRLGLKIAMPQINFSDGIMWKAMPNKKDTLLIPLKEIKGVGQVAVDAIMEEREKGEFDGYADFERRVDKRKCNAKVRRLLADCKAFSMTTECEHLSEAELEQLSVLFNFRLSNDPQYKFRKVMARLREFFAIDDLKSVADHGGTSKDLHFYFGEIERLVIGYRENLASDSKGSMGGVYCYLKDDTDFLMHIFTTPLYKRRKEEIEHCQNQWLLSLANFPHKDTAIQGQDCWFGDEILAGELNGLGLEMATKPKKFSKDLIREMEKCKLCSLRRQASQVVLPSQGDANIMIVGEAPGRQEDRQGIGFIGDSGELLWRALAEYGMDRSYFHITNTCKCWPSETRTPKKPEIKTCRKWLLEEAQTVQPFLILGLGNQARFSMVGEESGITEACGKTQWSDEWNCWICWCVHPAMVLRSPDNKELFDIGIDNFARKVMMLGFGEFFDNGKHLKP